MNGYYYLNEQQVMAIINSFRNSKDLLLKDIAMDLIFQKKNYSNQNSNYKLAANNKLQKIDSKAFTNEELVVDSDAIVSQSQQGAYVQCWLWVENENKTRKTRRKVSA